MQNWIRRPLLVALITLASLASAAVSSEDIAESQRLYDRANAFVSNINEDGYSYTYIQFHWKLAQSNLDRIQRVFPQTLIARQLRNNELKIGPYDSIYFRERVLPRLEEKKLASFDAVSCSLFLYNLQTQNTPERLETLTRIVEVLCRQKRWAEAMNLPVLGENRPQLISTVTRAAALDKNDNLFEKFITTENESIKKVLHPIIGEALALRGEDRTKIASYIEKHPETDVRLGILRGMVEREIQFHFAAIKKLEVNEGIQTTHHSIMHPEVRDNIETTAKTFFLHADTRVENLLLELNAAKGQIPPADAPLAAHRRYMEYLALTSKSDLLSNYLNAATRPANTQKAIQLNLIELHARMGNSTASEEARLIYSKQGTTESDQAALAHFLGQADSIVAPLTIRETTFAKLPINNPLVLANAILEWSLKPNRSIRGTLPWSAVVQRYQPSFENLPQP